MLSITSTGRDIIGTFSTVQSFPLRNRNVPRWGGVEAYDCMPLGERINLVAMSTSTEYRVEKKSTAEICVCTGHMYCTTVIIELDRY